MGITVAEYEALPSEMKPLFEETKEFIGDDTLTAVSYTHLTTVFKKLEDAYPGQVVVKDSHDDQGSEFKYTIVAVEWANLNSPNAFPVIYDISIL